MDVTHAFEDGLHRHGRRRQHAHLRPGQRSQREWDTKVPRERAPLWTDDAASSKVDRLLKKRPQKPGINTREVQRTVEVEFLTSSGQLRRVLVVVAGQGQATGKQILDTASHTNIAHATPVLDELTTASRHPRQPGPPHPDHHRRRRRRRRLLLPSATENPEAVRIHELERKVRAYQRQTEEQERQLHARERNAQAQQSARQRREQERQALAKEREHVLRAEELQLKRERRLQQEERLAKRELQLRADELQMKRERKLYKEKRRIKRERRLFKEERKLQRDRKLRKRARKLREQERQDHAQRREENNISYKQNKSSHRRHHVSDTMRSQDLSHDIVIWDPSEMPEFSHADLRLSGAILVPAALAFIVASVVPIPGLFWAILPQILNQIGCEVLLGGNKTSHPSVSRSVLGATVLQVLAAIVFCSTLLTADKIVHVSFKALALGAATLVGRAMFLLRDINFPVADAHAQVDENSNKVVTSRLLDSPARDKEVLNREKNQETFRHSSLASGSDVPPFSQTQDTVRNAIPLRFRALASLIVPPVLAWALALRLPIAGALSFSVATPLLTRFMGASLMFPEQIFSHHQSGQWYALLSTTGLALSFLNPIVYVLVVLASATLQAWLFGLVFGFAPVLFPILYMRNHLNEDETFIDVISSAHGARVIGTALLCIPPGTLGLGALIRGPSASVYALVFPWTARRQDRWVSQTVGLLGWISYLVAIVTYVTGDHATFSARDPRDFVLAAGFFAWVLMITSLLLFNPERAASERMRKNTGEAGGGLAHILYEPFALSVLLGRLISALILTAGAALFAIAFVVDFYAEVRAVRLVGIPLVICGITGNIYVTYTFATEVSPNKRHSLRALCGWGLFAISMSLGWATVLCHFPATAVLPLEQMCPMFEQRRSIAMTGLLGWVAQVMVGHALVEVLRGTRKLPKSSSRRSKARKPHTPEPKPRILHRRAPWPCDESSSDAVIEQDEQVHANLGDDGMSGDELQGDTGVSEVDEQQSTVGGANESSSEILSAASDDDSDKENADASENEVASESEDVAENDSAVENEELDQSEHLTSDDARSETSSEVEIEAEVEAESGSQTESGSSAATRASTVNEEPVEEMPDISSDEDEGVSSGSESQAERSFLVSPQPSPLSQTSGQPPHEGQQYTSPLMDNILSSPGVIILPAPIAALHLPDLDEATTGSELNDSVLSPLSIHSVPSSDTEDEVLNATSASGLRKDDAGKDATNADPGTDDDEQNSEPSLNYIAASSDASSVNTADADADVAAEIAAATFEDGGVANQSEAASSVPADESPADDDEKNGSKHADNQDVVRELSSELGSASHPALAGEDDAMLSVPAAADDETTLLVDATPQAMDLLVAVATVDAAATVATDSTADVVTDTATDVAENIVPSNTDNAPSVDENMSNFADAEEYASAADETASIFADEYASAVDDDMPQSHNPPFVLVNNPSEAHGELASRIDKEETTLHDGEQVSDTLAAEASLARDGTDPVDGNVSAAVGTIHGTESELEMSVEEDNDDDDNDDGVSADHNALATAQDELDHSESEARLTDCDRDIGHASVTENISHANGERPPLEETNGDDAAISSQTETAVMDGDDTLHDDDQDGDDDDDQDGDDDDGNADDGGANEAADASESHDGASDLQFDDAKKAISTIAKDGDDAEDIRRGYDTDDQEAVLSDVRRDDTDDETLGDHASKFSTPGASSLPGRFALSLSEPRTFGRSRQGHGVEGEELVDELHVPLDIVCGHDQDSEVESPKRLPLPLPVELSSDEMDSVYSFCDDNNDDDDDVDDDNSDNKKNTDNVSSPEGAKAEHDATVTEIDVTKSGEPVKTRATTGGAKVKNNSEVEVELNLKIKVEVGVERGGRISNVEVITKGAGASEHAQQSAPASDSPAVSADESSEGRKSVHENEDEDESEDRGPTLDVGPVFRMLFGTEGSMFGDDSDESDDEAKAGAGNTNHTEAETASRASSSGSVHTHYGAAKTPEHDARSLSFSSSDDENDGDFGGAKDEEDATVVGMKDSPPSETFMSSHAQSLVPRDARPSGRSPDTDAPLTPLTPTTPLTPLTPPRTRVGSVPSDATNATSERVFAAHASDSDDDDDDVSSTELDAETVLARLEETILAALDNGPSDSEASDEEAA
ncbi:Hypothetical Protein FCC1311_098052 [Hondaea fermentalgiana]|uniref:Uncharacterized protein n=1 Tax=Hondaea fermentalgiana TaxID=2315210 RepID=A0A2R5GRS8_9STRA|nr:Hypothetical Protein FCC1311_098052 [Hondaea fermentalgiana]|eukprot:GBG33582.1 Hypothetical Protein FCC1311_098052 [Hondaea fermentalgiana]